MQREVYWLLYLELEGSDAEGIMHIQHVLSEVVREDQLLATSLYCQKKEE